MANIQNNDILYKFSNKIFSLLVKISSTIARIFFREEISCQDVDFAYEFIKDLFENQINSRNIDNFNVDENRVAQQSNWNTGDEPHNRKSKKKGGPVNVDIGDVSKLSKAKQTIIFLGELESEAAKKDNSNFSISDLKAIGKS